MQLGGNEKASDVFDAIRQDEGLSGVPQSGGAFSMETGVGTYKAGNSPQLSESKSGYLFCVASNFFCRIQIQIDEKISVSLNRDGGVESLEVKGELILRIVGPASACLRIAIDTQEDFNLQFKVSL